MRECNLAIYNSATSKFFPTFVREENVEDICKQFYSSQLSPNWLIDLSVH